MAYKQTIKQSTPLWLLYFILQTATAIQADQTANLAASQDSRQSSQTGISLPELIYNSSEHFTDIDSANLDGLLERIGDSRLVLLGEATHGTAEFYDMRARITRALIENKGFTIVAVEADWPDAQSIQHDIQGTEHNPKLKHKPFTTFPTWMWANHSVQAFTQWLKDYNQRIRKSVDMINFYGLDFYNMYASIEVVLDYLQAVDPEAGERAYWRYACLMPWTSDPATYSRAMLSGRHRHCGYEVHAVLQQIHNKRAHYSHLNTQRYFNAVQNARLVKNAEYFYRNMYNASINTWNLRDQSMFDTLLEVLNNSDQNSKVIVWGHNSHIGDARATEMPVRGEINLGQRVREHFADSAYLVGFGTDHGTVGAASEWNQPMQVMQIPPAHSDSYEHQFHQVKTDNFLLPLRQSPSPSSTSTRTSLLKKRLQRAIGTTYYPDNELNIHYTRVSLPEQFDEYIWFDETHAVVPLSTTTVRGATDTYPSGL
jgi:protein-L-isoaspartate(D-aspartate) O-methyltransferase